ncbi:uncharacterized protein VTP21DRAFT_3202 [Calcarisporiella thermophila]|uniref:uncharacterized protein n=1 Tax=Calcarisporiella thermophila TaxID=911321 RepID=UPI003743C75F
MRLLGLSFLLLLGAASAQPVGKGDDFVNIQIWGGVPVKPGELPSTVYIRGRSYACTGSLIKPDVVLTAAHCVESSGVTIRANSLSASSGGQVVRVTRGLQHENYRRNQDLKYDVGLLFLASSVQNAMPIKISPDAPKEGDIITAAGWGVTESQNTSDKLLKVDLKVGGDGVCGRNYPDWGGLAGPHICYQPVRGKGICYGDSGGPAYKVIGGTNYILGVSSFISKDDCGGASTIGYFTRLGYHLDWIKRNAGVSATQE